MNDNYLTIKEAAGLLSIHWQTVRNLIHSGKLPYMKFGKSYRIKHEDLADYQKLKHPAKQMVEVERRFLLNKSNTIEENLRKQGAKLVNHTHVIDHWFVPNHVKSMEDNLEFFEGKDGFSVRVREAIDVYSNRNTITIEIKKLINSSHANCLEHEVVVQSLADAGKLLNLMNFKKVITIDKERFVYALGEIKYAFDSIKNFGTGFEVEIKSDQPLQKAEEKIFKAAARLGLKKTDAEEKSVTYLVLRKLADWS